MKKILYIFIFVFLSQGVFSQERFFSLYPGWTISTVYWDTDTYNLYGLDTLDFGYSNTPINVEITDEGGLIDSKRYVSDTLASFSIYSPKSYKVYQDYIMACGVYVEYYKDYNLEPIFMYFNHEDYNLDSLIDLRSSFDEESTIIRFMQVEEDTVYFGGETNLSFSQYGGAYFAKYSFTTGEVSIVTYTKPSLCKMTPYQILPTEDGGYLMATEQDMAYTGPEEVYACVLKIDATGNEQWRYIIEGQIDIPPWGLQAATFRPRIFDSPDGNYFVVWTDPFFNEYIGQPNTEMTIRIGKLTDYGTYGEISEETDLRPSLDNFERAPYIINDSFQDADGTMYILLQSQNGYQSAFAKIHPNGVGAWLRVYRCYPDNDATLTTTQLYGITKTDDGGFMLTGAFYSNASTMFPGGMLASVVFKVDSCGCFDEAGCNDHCMDSYSEHYVYMQQASIFPNPASDKVTVSFDYKGGETEFNYKVYSLDGKVLAYGTTRQRFGSAQQPSRGNVDITTGSVGDARCFSTENCNLKIDVCDLPSGYYMIQFWGGGKIFTGKFVKE